MKRIGRCMILILLLTAGITTGCQSQAESPSQTKFHEKPQDLPRIPYAIQPPPGTKVINVTVHTVKKDGSNVEGAYVKAYDYKLGILTSPEGWKTDHSGTTTLQLSDQAMVRIEVVFPNGKKVSKEITVSSKVRNIRFIQP